MKQDSLEELISFFVFLDWAFVLQKQLMINGSY